MKKLVLLVVFAAILLCGYAYLWNQNADHLKKDVETGVSNINKEIGQNALSYAVVDTSGFPVNLTVNLKNVKFQLDDHFKALTDYLDIARGFVGNSFTNKMGNLSLTFPPITPDDKPIQLLVKSNSDAYTELAFKENQLLNFLTGKLSMSPVLNIDFDWKKLLEHLQSYKAKSSGLQIIDENTGHKLVTSGPASSKLNIDRIDPISHKIDLEVSVVDQEFTPEFEKLMRTLATQLQKVTNRNAASLYALNLSAMGKSNLHLKATYKGITDFAAGTPNWQADLVISKFEHSNRLQSGISQGSMLLKSTEDPKKDSGFNLQGALDFNGNYLVSPAMNEYFKTAYANTAKLLLENPPKNKEADENYQLQLMIAQFMAKHANEVLPDFARMGETKYALDVKFNEEDKTILLKDLSLAMSKYGIALTGKGTFENTSDRPNGFLDISLKNYQAFVSDLVDYATKIAQVAKEEGQGKMDVKLSLNFKPKLIEFLSDLATKPESNSNDIVIRVSFDGDNVKVGDMDSNQALMNFMMILGAQ